MHSLLSTFKNKYTMYIENKKMIEKIILDIESKYHINILDANPLKNGFVHLNFKCRTNDNKKYVLRVYRNIELTDIQLEDALLVRLTDYPVLRNHIIPMVPDINGLKISQVDNFYYSLFNYVENDPIQYLNLAQINNVASIVRNIHDIGSHIYEEFSNRSLIDTYEIINTFKNRFAEQAITDDEYHNLINIVTSYDHLIKQYQDKTILHCDIHRNNILLNKADDNLVLIDFDDFRVGPSIIDLAIMIQMLCFEKKEFDITMAKQILFGYYSNSHSNVKININDLLMIMLFNLAYACEYYLQEGLQDNYAQFKMGYTKILNIQKSAGHIVKELSSLDIHISCVA